MEMQEQLLRIYEDQFNNDPLLVDLIDQAARRTDWMLHICNDITSLRTDFVSDTCFTFFGIQPHVFAAGGAKAMYDITREDSRPEAMARQIEYLKESKQPEFNRAMARIQHFSVWMKTPVDYERFHIRGVALTYHPSGDFQMGLAITHRDSDSLAAACETWLTTVKHRHNAIHQPPDFQESGFPLHQVYGGFPPHAITPREAEALQLLAQGLATQQIADRMNISYHTVETYRRNLLEKFEAKNTAELIKKASKVFWLE